MSKIENSDSSLVRPKYFSLLESFVQEGISVQYGKDKDRRLFKLNLEDKSTLNQKIQQMLRVNYEQIATKIEQTYKGRDFEFFIAELLRVQGFQVQVSAIGPDGGVDILASSQRLGANKVKMCVQVKSSVNPIDYRILTQFAGVIHKFNATCGMLVCWGGFSQQIKDEQALLFFKIKLWSKEDVVRNFLMYYPLLDKKYREAIPLRKVWSVDMEKFNHNSSKS